MTHDGFKLSYVKKQRSRTPKRKKKSRSPPKKTKKSRTPRKKTKKSISPLTIFEQKIQKLIDIQKLIENTLTAPRPAVVTAPRPAVVTAPRPAVVTEAERPERPVGDFELKRNPDCNEIFEKLAMPTDLTNDNYATYKEYLDRALNGYYYSTHLSEKQDLEHCNEEAEKKYKSIKV